MSQRLGELRHGICGLHNAITLCVSAFDTPLETSEKLEFLTDIESAADRLLAMLEEFEAASDVPEAGSSVGSQVR